MEGNSCEKSPTDLAPGLSVLLFSRPTQSLAHFPLYPDANQRLFAPHEGYLFKDVDRKTGATIGILGSLGQRAISTGHTRGEASMDLRDIPARE
jgi:hypothetical protein